MKVDYLIVGQGISGTLLSWYLLKEGSTLKVIADTPSSSASYASGGIINPVTGKRLVRSWITMQLSAFAHKAYTELGVETGTQLVAPTSILDFHYNPEAKGIFDQRREDEKEYLGIAGDEQWSPYFRFNYGIGEVCQCLLVDTRAMVGGWRRCLAEKGVLIEERFSHADCVAENGEVIYKNISAKKIIFCEGAAGGQNPYFDKLPWSKDKGEALIADIPGLPRTHIFKQGISILPWENGLFWVGASHDWKYTEEGPTAAFRRKITEQLDYWLKLPYIITDHIVALRPANMERRPFVGMHPLYTPVGILNGMGGKGCSMAPFFASQLAKHLSTGAAIMPEADVKRFTRILSR